MGKGAKVQVTEYYMSQHFGICSPVDALLKIIVKEKDAWAGWLSGQQALVIDKPDLFGGVKKEGGVRGTAYFLPGAADQVLPDVLAQRLGRANGADAPGYRGLASVFFIGDADHRGFYWTANNPYLPGVWATVRRAPIGLTEAYALVPRPGSNFHPYQIETGGSGVGGDFSPDFSRYYQMDGANLFVWDVESRTVVATATLATDFFTVSDDAIYVKAGGPGSSDLELWRYEPDGSGGTLLVHGFDGFVGSPRYVAGQVLFYPGTSNEVNYGTWLGDSVAMTALDFSATHFFEGPGGAIFAVGVDQFTEDNLHIQQLGTLGSSTVLTTAGSAAVGMWNGTNIVVWQGNTLRLLDPVTFAELATDTLTIGLVYAANAFNAVRPGTFRMWVGFTQFDTLTLATLRTVDPNDWIAQGSLTGSVYDSVNNAIMSHEFGTQEVTWRFLDRGDLDANPAHVIYEALTNTDWGMGSPSSLIDVAGFEDVGVVLYNEPLGLSMIWTRQSSIQDFIQEVLDHIQGALFVDPQTGLLTLKLIRGDYDVGTLPTIDPSNATLTNFGRKLWGEIVNEISVTWTNPDNEQDETVTVHDLASIATQGGIISDSRNYYGVRYAALAQRLAARDLRSAGAPLAACDAEIDRTMWFLRPASVVLLDWPEYGLVGLVMRVTSIDYGKPGDMTLKVSLIEDVFGLDAGDYVDPPSTSWEDTSSPPSAMSEQEALTLPYYMAKNAVTSIEGAAYPEVIAGVLGASANADVYGFELWGEVSLPDGSTEWQSLSSLNILGRAELAAGLNAEAASTGVTFSSFIGSKSPQQAGFAIIGAAGEDGNELALITAASSTYALSRGVLDTVPRAWASGTPVWFIDGDALFEDTTARSVGEVVEYRLRTRTSQGMLDLFLAPLLTATMTDRPWLPSRPAKVEIDSVQFNTDATPVDMTARTDPWVTVTWAARNRLSEDMVLLNWTDATVTPETGQTTTVTVYAADATTVLATHTGLSGTSFDVPDVDFGTEDVVLIVPTASRTDADGTFESLQGHGVWVRVALASAAEGASGVGAASFAGAQIMLSAFSGSGAGTTSPTGNGAAARSMSGSGSAAASIAGSTVAAAALSAAGTGAMSAVGSAGASSPYGSWDTWEVQIDANNGGATRTTLGSLRFYDVNGTLIPTTGGTAYSAGSGSDEAGADSSKAFDSNDASTWSRTSTTNTRIGYQFATAQPVASIEIVSGSGNVAPRTARLRYGTGGSGASFTTAFEIWEPSWDLAAQSTRVWPQSFAGGKYKQIRFRVSACNDRFPAITELEFRGTVSGADQTSGGASSCDQGGVNFAFAFDNNLSNTSFIDTSGSPFPSYIAYSFATPVVVAEYQLYSNSSNARIPKDFKLQGTNDGVTITDLNTQAAITGVIPFTFTKAV